MPTKKIVFLDIDGVISLELERPGVNGATAYKFSGLDSTRIERLNEVVNATGAKVVVSSSWKKRRTAEQLHDYFVERGFEGEIIDVTPTLDGIGPGQGRGHEIQYWIYQNWPVDAFVIFDDGYDMVHLMDHLVQTESALGLQPHHVERAKILLGEKTS